MPRVSEPSAGDASSGFARAAPLLLAAAFVALAIWERREPLRPASRPRGARLIRNLAIGAGGAAVVARVEGPVVRRLADLGERHGLGIVRRTGLPAPAQQVLALLLMDWSLYAWHVLMHRVPFLWRWHRIHHADPDLDASTALRFHAMEMLCSVPWRAAQVLVIGVPSRTLALWGRLTLAEVMFHHADVRLPPAVERRLSRFVVTPRLHGIHHSDVAAHQRTNLSSGLALWDLLHGSRCESVPQHALTMGLPAPAPAPAPRAGEPPMRRADSPATMERP